MTIRITWDRLKAESNLVKHRVSFVEAEEVFDDVLSITVIDPGQPAEEERFITVGVSRRGRLERRDYEG